MIRPYRYVLFCFTAAVCLLIAREARSTPVFFDWLNVSTGTLVTDFSGQPIPLGDSATAGFLQLIWVGPDTEANPLNPSVVNGAGGDDEVLATFYFSDGVGAVPGEFWCLSLIDDSHAGETVFVRAFEQPSPNWTGAPVDPIPLEGYYGDSVDRFEFEAGGFFAMTESWQTDTLVIPEPATMLLYALGVAAMGAVRSFGRRRGP